MIEKGALSHREQEVMNLIKLGMSNAEIGTKLGVASATVKQHLERICFKTGAKNRTHAAYMWGRYEAS